MDIANEISKSLAEKIIIAKVCLVKLFPFPVLPLTSLSQVNGELWDLERPLEGSCTLSLLDFDSPDNNFEARQVFWHSSAHVLGESCERHFEGCCLGYGPPQEEGGFFYEMRLKDNRWVVSVGRGTPD